MSEAAAPPSSAPASPPTPAAAQPTPLELLRSKPYAALLILCAIIDT